MNRTTGDAVWIPCISTTHIGEHAIWPIAGERLSRARSQLGISNPRGFIITIIIIIIVTSNTDIYTIGETRLEVASVLAGRHMCAHSQENMTSLYRSFSVPMKHGPKLKSWLQSFKVLLTVFLCGMLEKGWSWRVSKRIALRCYATQRGGTSQDSSYTLISLCASETVKGQ